MKKYADGSVVRVRKVKDPGSTYVAELDKGRWFVTAHRYHLGHEEFFERFVVEEVLAGGEVEPTWEEGSVVAGKHVAYIFESREEGWTTTARATERVMSTEYIDRLVEAGAVEILRGGLSYA